MLAVAGRRLRDRGVPSRILGGVVAAWIVAVAAGLLGLSALAAATDRTRAMYEQHTVGVQLAVEARYQYSAYRFAGLNRASAPTPDVAQQYQAQRDEAQAALLAALDGLRSRAAADGTLLPAVAQVQVSPPRCRTRPGRAPTRRPTPRSACGRGSSPWSVPAACWRCRAAR